MIIADTNIVSELMRMKPARNVRSWCENVKGSELAISVITIEEIERGLMLLAAGQRRDALESAWQRFTEHFSARVVDYTADAARETARIEVESMRAGRPMQLADAQIAGMCVAHGAALATRNTRDFQNVPGLELIDPFVHGAG